MSVLSQFTGGSSTLPFKVSPTAIPIEALVLGGGGGGGSDTTSIQFNGAGGGAGRLVSLSGVLVNPGDTFQITVGQPGTAGLYNFGVPIRAGSGQNSSIGILQAEGGGGGATDNTILASGGGCGGGGALPGDLGPPVLPSTASYNVNSLSSAAITGSYGTSGGAGGISLTSGGTQYYSSGGGGGTSGAGINGLVNNGGTGGPGTLSAITGINVYYGGGGGGGAYIDNIGSGTASRGLGGVGGGGNGGNASFTPTSALANSGGGGGGGGGVSGQNGGAGGSGIVIIAYKDTYPLATTTGAPTLYSAFNPASANATRTGYHVYVFTGAGSITFN